MPTPVGPAPRDPNDPDFWDWDPPRDRAAEGLAARRHPATAVVALIVVAALLLLVVLSVL